MDSVTKGLKNTNIGIDSLTSLGIAATPPAGAADDTADSKSVTATVPGATPEPAPLVSLIQFDSLVAAELTKIHPSAIGLMHPQRHFRAAVYAYLVKEMYGDDPAGFAIIDMRVDLALVGVAPEWVIKVHPALGNVDNHFHVKYTKIRNEVRPFIHTGLGICQGYFWRSEWLRQYVGGYSIFTVARSERLMSQFAAEHARPEGQKLSAKVEYAVTR